MNDTDSAAFAVEQAWRDHHDAVRDMVARKCRDAHLAEDIAAETFVRMLRYLSVPENEEPRHLRAWLYTVARNLLADHYKAPTAQRELLAFDPLTQCESEVSPQSHVPLETWESVLDLLELLPEHQRLVVILRGLREMSVDETAEYMGISNQAVRYLRYAAKKRLADERSALTENVIEIVTKPQAERTTEPPAGINPLPRPTPRRRTAVTKGQ